MKFEATIDDVVRRVSIEGDGGVYQVQIDDGPVRQIAATRPEEGVISLILEDARAEAGLVRRELGYDVTIDGVLHEITIEDPRKKALRLATGTVSGAIRTTMPGRVVSLLVSVGQQVSVGEPVVVVEAMKMENELKAQGEGTVTAIHVQAGDLVESGTVLVEIE